MGQLGATRKFQSVVNTAVPLKDKDFGPGTVRHTTYEIFLSAYIWWLKLCIERYTKCVSGSKIRDRQVAKLWCKYSV